jgi:phosphoglycerate kinase
MRKLFIAEERDEIFLNKRVLVRVDYNVPLYLGEHAQLRVSSDERIRDSLETIRFLMSKGSLVTLCSHLGRPNGRIDPKLSLRPVAEQLQKLMPDVEVIFLTDCVGEEVERVKGRQQRKQLILLENVRFYPEELHNDERFARNLGNGFEVFVNDAFSASHRGMAPPTVLVILPSNSFLYVIL